MGLLNSCLEVVKDAQEKGRILGWKKNPRLLSHWIEDYHPSVARVFLSYASQLLEPHLLALGIEVISCTDTGVVTCLPGRWKNRDLQGEASFGSLVSLGEFTLRLFWERHLQPFSEHLSIGEVTIQRDKDFVGAVEASLCIKSCDLDQWMFLLRSQSQVALQVEIILSHQATQRRMGSMEFALNLKGAPALEAKKGE